MATLGLRDPRVAKLYPACPIRQHLGILCPGCGATRALAALLHGDLLQALRLNPLTTLLLPLALLYVASLLRRLWHDDPHPFPRIPRVVTCTLFALASAFTIVRNL